MKYTIVFNLAYNNDAERYLPDAYLGELTPKGLGYMRAKATDVTIHSYKSVAYDMHHQKCMKIINALSPEFLEEKYNSKGKRKKKLKDLFADKTISRLINQYVDRCLDELLQLIIKFDLPLCLDLVRKVELETIRIQFSKYLLEPILKFKKTNAGVEYQLKLQGGQKVISCFDYDVKLCTNDPAWIIINHRLYSINHINSAKLKPFLKKNTVLIPPSSTKVYFEKFILQMASQLEIDTEGFDVSVSDEIETVTLRMNKDFFKDAQILEMVFQYKGATFGYQNSARQKSKLNFSEGNEIDIIKVERSPKENEYVDRLTALGMQLTAAKYFELNEEAEDKFEVLYWVSENYDSLVDAGFSVEMPKVENKLISLDKASIVLQSEERIDWFELHGCVVIGDYEIPFLDLLDNVRNEDRYFSLPNGTYFIIPEAWMAKYSKLANFAEKSPSGFKIQKSNYVLLEELDVEGTSPDAYVVGDQEIDFQESPYLKATLRPYQIEGVRWLIKHQMNNLGACLADDMGLGKTLQTIALLNYTKDNLEISTEEQKPEAQLDLFGQAEAEKKGPLKALIVLPSSLVFNWYDEIQKFSPRLQTIKYIGANRKVFHSKLDAFDVVLTTYGTARIDIDRLNKVYWKYIILDESHMIKNKDSQSFKALTTLQSENKLTLTGTPIENSLSDLWSQMEFINPNMLGDYNFFKKNFKTPIEKYKDESVLEDVKLMVEPFILRRRKKDVAKDLPPLIKHIEYVDMDKDQSDIYKKEKNAIRNYLLSMDEKSGEYRMHVLASLLHLRQIANHPILFNNAFEGTSGKFEMLKEKLAGVLKSQNKVLIFSAFTTHLDLVENHLIDQNYNYVTITGKTTSKKRENAVKKFQTDDNCGVFLISLKAGGVGLNLTQADYVFILDPWWNPFIEEQAVARAHRIGKENPVTVIKFISRNTLEEKIVKLQARKTVLSADLLEAEEVARFTREELADLLA